MQITFEALVNIFFQVAFLVITDPAKGIPAVFSIAIGITVVIGLLGMLLGQNWWDSLFSTWRWAIYSTFSGIVRGVHALADIGVHAFGRRFEAERPLGRIIAFGANVVFFILWGICRIFAAITSGGSTQRAPATTHH